MSQSFLTLFPQRRPPGLILQVSLLDQSHSIVHILNFFSHRILVPGLYTQCLELEARRFQGDCYLTGKLLH